MHRPIPCRQFEALHPLRDVFRRSREAAPIARKAIRRCSHIRSTSYSKSPGRRYGKRKRGSARETRRRASHQREIVEGRAVIGDGAPFDAQSRSLGIQGRSQTAALSKLAKRYRVHKHGRARKVACNYRNPARSAAANFRGTACVLRKTYFSSLFWRQYFNSGLISVISMPALTRNLQLRSSCGRSSSVSFPTTRQYWQS